MKVFDNYQTDKRLIMNNLLGENYMVITNVVIDDTVIEKEEVEVFRLPMDKILDGEDVRMLVNSPNINNGTAGLSYLKPEKQYLGEPEPVSQWFAAFSNGFEVVFLGFKLPIYRRTIIEYKAGVVSCRICVDESHPDFDNYQIESLVIIQSDTYTNACEKFMKICSVEKSSADTNLFYGWNSWDYYMSFIDLPAAKENAKMLNEHFDNKSKGFIVIDDGWQVSRGDWSVNGKFCNDIEEFSKVTEPLKLKKGLWNAPFYINTSCENYSALTLVKNINGEVVILYGYALADITDPNTCERILDYFRYYRKKGVLLFKLDFLHHLATESDLVFYKDRLPRIFIIYNFLKKVKEVVGEDAKIIACGCPPEAAIAADICRVGGDISPFNSTVRLLVPFLATRYFMNRNLFLSDPDFLITRSVETSTSGDIIPFMKKEIGEVYWDEIGSRSGSTWCKISEVQVWATLIGMSGGIITLADRLKELNAEGLSVINKVLRFSGTETAKPIDLFEREYPAVWERVGSKPAIAFINCYEEPITISISVTSLKADLSNQWRNVWNGEELLHETKEIIVVYLEPLEAKWYVKEEEYLCQMD